MPGKPRGARALSDAQRAARYRLRKAEQATQQQSLGAEAIAFLMQLPDAETYSMTWDSKKWLREFKARVRAQAVS
jgi:hypothetical protein